MNLPEFKPSTKRLLATFHLEVDKIRQSLIPEVFREKHPTSVAPSEHSSPGDHTACPHCAQAGVGTLQLDAGNDSQ